MSPTSERDPQLQSGSTAELGGADTWSLGKRLRVAVACRAVYLLARALLTSYRYEIIGREHRQAAERLHPSGSFCLAAWHEHLFATTLAHTFQHFSPLVSPSADGELVTYVMRKFGLDPIRGSSSRGGPDARRHLVDKTNAGWFTAITVDGPRGPRRVVKGGVVDVARRTGVPILPAIAATPRAWILRKTWDQFKIPPPFSRIVLCYAPPIVVPAETDGLAFGEVKNAVRAGIDAAEQSALAAFARHV